MAEAFHLGDAVIRIIADLGELEKGMSDVQAFMTGAFRGMSNLGQDLTKAVTLPIIGIGTAAVFTAAQFDQAMRNVNAVMQLPEDQFRDLQKQVLDFATTTRAGATEVANALYSVAAAGYAGSEAFTIMEAAAHAAGASMSSTVVTSNLLISTLKAYGFEAEKSAYLMDLFMATSNESIMTLTELSHAMTTLTGIGGVMGISIEELSAALATVNKTQTDSALAATYLRSLLTSLLKPSEALKVAFAEMGYESGGAAIKALGFSGVIKELSLKYGENADALSALFPDQRALLGSTILLKNGTQEYITTLANLSQVEGAVNRAREQQYSTLLPQLDRLKNAFEVIFITIGMKFVPALADLAEALVPIVRSFADIPDPVLQAGIALAAMAAALGPILMLVGGLGQFIIAIQVMVPLIGTWVAAMGAAQVAAIGLAATLGPLFLLGAIAAVIAVGVAYTAQLKETSAQLLDTAKSAEEYAEGMDKARIATVEATAANLRNATGTVELLDAQVRQADMAVYNADQQKKVAAQWGQMYQVSREKIEENTVALQEMGEAAGQAQREMQMALMTTRAGAIIDVREGIVSFQELRDKVIEFNYDISEDTYRRNQDMARMVIDRARAEEELLRRHAEKLLGIEARMRAESARAAQSLSDLAYDRNSDMEDMTSDRATSEEELLEDQAKKLADIKAKETWWSGEETQALYEQQQKVNAEELADFNALWDEKKTRRQRDYDYAVQQVEERRRMAEAELQAEYDREQAANARELEAFNILEDEKKARREEDYVHAVGLAWQQAEERRKIDEAARLAEMEAARQATEERIRLFAYEIMENQGLLTIQLGEGTEAMKLTAQQYMDLVDTGILPVTTDMQNAFNNAMSILTTGWGDSTTAAQTSIDTQKGLVSAAFDELTKVGADAAGAVDMATPLEENAAAMASAMQGYRQQVGDLLAGAAGDSKTAVDDMSAQITGYQTEASTAMATLATDVDAGLSTVNTSWSETLGGMVTGVKNMAVDVLREVQNLIRDMKAAFSGADWFKVGDDIAKGIASGIDWGAHRVVHEAVVAVEEAIAAAREAAGAYSPAREFMAIGEDMAAGLALGMSDAKAAVIDVSRNVVGGMVGAVPAMVPAMAPAVGQLGQGAQGRNVTIEIGQLVLPSSYSPYQGKKMVRDFADELGQMMIRQGG